MAKEKAQDEIPAIAGLTFAELQECLTLGASFDHVRELASSGFSFAQIKQLALSLGAAQRAHSGGGVSANDLKELLQAQRKVLKPENEQHPGISVYSYPEGELVHPKPPFVRDVFFNDLRERHDQLSTLEVELYNRFDTNKTARNGMWRAEIRRNGSAEELRIITEPKTLDGRLSLPPLTMILRELLDGADAVNPDTMAKRVADLEAALKSLAERQPAGAAA